MTREKRISKVNKDQEKVKELDRVVKMLIKRDLMLSRLREEREKEIAELDRITKMLVRRDLELSELREKREQELKELEGRTKELENSRKALMNILEDIDEARTEAEEQRNRTMAIIEEFPEGILFFNDSGVLESANSQIEFLFGVSPEKIIGKNLRDLQKVPSLQSLMDLLGSPIKRLEREELNISEELVFEVSTIYIHREKRVIGTLVVIRDISREKLIEQLKTEFVSLAAHQLRTPLSAIKWTLKMLLDGDLGEITKEQREFIEKTYQSNERMIRLINDLLNVTRIEEGRFLYNIQKEDLREIIKDCVKISKEAAEKKGLKVIVQLPSDSLPKVSVDREKISLAIQNLIDNAVNYTKKGHIKVSLSFNKNKKEFLVSVEDTGIGIPKEQQKRLFVKFFRASNAQRLNTEGSGLGLFIAKNVIEAHKGKIWFESEAGKGTTFYFTIPAKEEPEEFLRRF